MTYDEDLIPDDSQDPEYLQWFSFLRESDQLRFRDIFEAAIAAAKRDYEALRDKLVRPVLELGLGAESGQRAGSQAAEGS